MLVLDLELRIVITMGYLISDQFKMHFMPISTWRSYNSDLKKTSNLKSNPNFATDITLKCNIDDILN